MKWANRAAKIMGAELPPYIVETEQELKKFVRGVIDLEDSLKDQFRKVSLPYAKHALGKTINMLVYALDLGRFIHDLQQRNRQNMIPICLREAFITLSCTWDCRETSTARERERRWRKYVYHKCRKELRKTLALVLTAEA